MVHFSVRASSLTEVAALLGSVVATFDSHVASVDSSVQSTLGTWKGDDATALQENWKTFVSLSEAVRMSLTNLQTGLMHASAGYDTTETGVRRSMAQATPSVQGLRKHAQKFGAGVARGEERAEDMAEFFGRDYAGDDEVEEFGGGAVRGSNGRYTGGRRGDTDGDGDDDSIGTGPFLSNESIEELGDATDAEPAGFVHGDDGTISQSPDAEGGSVEPESPETDGGDAPEAGGSQEGAVDADGAEGSESDADGAEDGGDAPDGSDEADGEVDGSADEAGDADGAPNGIGGSGGDGDGSDAPVYEGGPAEVAPDQLSGDREFSTMPASADGVDLSDAPGATGDGGFSSMPASVDGVDFSNMPASTGDGEFSTMPGWMSDTGLAGGDAPSFDAMPGDVDGAEA
ncbi:hypothetical protein [Microbacterium karelineae]|uniref:hypothetical protein n=1 Tax=Microbacterium karelineae TaxID=2654283 RepID=UPI0012EAB1CD|nr:hypothetical protein [Microbacterium karelineae]